MDKHYRIHFLSQLKARMRLDRAEFAPAKVPKDHPLRWQFSGGVLYLRQLPSGRCVWLDWIPAEGVEREFFACLGWSFAAAALPCNTPGDMRIHSIRGPTAGMATGNLNVQSIEGRRAVRGFRIDTPWEQLNRLSPRVPEEERRRVMDKAYAEYLAVTEAERVDAVRAAMNEAFASVAAVLRGLYRGAGAAAAGGVVIFAARSGSGRGRSAWRPTHGSVGLRLRGGVRDARATEPAPRMRADVAAHVATREVGETRTKDPAP